MSETTPPNPPPTTTEAPPPVDDRSAIHSADNGIDTGEGGPASSPTPAPEPWIERDLLCHACLYNLRSLRKDARCPECGTPVADTLARVVLDQARRQDVETFRSGIYQLAWSLLFTALLMPGTIFFGVLMDGDEGIMVVLVGGVLIEYVFWGAGVASIVRALRETEGSNRSAFKAATKLGWSTTGAAVLTVLTLAYAVFANSGEVIIFTLLVLLVAAVQALRVGSILAVGPAVLDALRNLTLPGHAKALKAATVAGLITTAALGLSHLLMLPATTNLEPWDDLAAMFVLAAVIAAIACYVAAFWASVTLFINGGGVSKVLARGADDTTTA